MESGVGVLHPADELHVANGLQPHGDDRVFATVAPDEAPELVGPDANYSIAEALERSAAADQFHAVVQLRSTPEAPMSIRPVGGSGFEWREETLHVTVDVEPWGSLDRIDDDDRREALRSADELVYTSVWDLSPTPDDLPENLTLELATRG